MKIVSCVVAAAALAGTVAGCADPYSPQYGYSQGYANPSSGYAYTYPTSSYAAPRTAYYAPSYSYPAYSSYGYRSEGDYYRHYNGIHAGPEVSMIP